MLAISLILVGITLILNGIFLWKNTNKTLVITLNLFTGFVLLFFNLTSVVWGDQSKLTSYFGGILFGLTNLIIAFDKMFESETEGSGYYCLLATLCAISLSCYYFATTKTLQGVTWILWCMIWLFSFVGFALKKNFLPATYLMYIIQGVVTTGILGFLVLFQIVVF